MKPCIKCQAPLFTAVAYCPFCGAAADGDGHKAATAPPAPARAAAVATPASESAAPPIAAAAPTDAAAAPARKAVSTPVARPAPAAAAVAPGPATVTTPPTAHPAAPAAVPPPPKKNGVGKWIVAALVLILVVAYLRGKPDPAELACNTAFDAGTKAVASKDLAGARVQATTANGVCMGASRGKAASLQAAIDAAENTSTACLRSFRTIEGHVDDHKLASARSALNELSSVCSVDADAAAWRAKLAVAVADAQTVQAALRTAIDGKDLGQSKSLLQKLLNANRENPDSPALKGEVDQLAAELAVAAVAPPAAVPAPAAPEAVAAPPASAIAPPRAVARRNEPDNGASAKTEMAAAFLRDAETALAQKRFDAARTYVDSARRMDPSNPRLDSLTQQIHDRERQVLQQEIIIR